MLIVIDSREKELYQCCIKYMQMHNNIDNIRIQTSSIPLGDIIIYDDTDKENLVENIIIERKTVNDLACSIRDSRYREQGFRLNECSTHNHNIFYLIEGSFSQLNKRHNKNTILSAIASISYYKGFSLYKTASCQESAEWIIRIADKINRTKDKPYYLNSTHSSQEPESCLKDTMCLHKNTQRNEKTYSSVVKRVKKENITCENVGEIMLMQIPGVSQASANAIMNKYKTIPCLVTSMSSCDNSLSDISISTSSGKHRKLNKTCIANMYKYLLPDSQKVITIKNNKSE